MGWQKDLASRGAGAGGTRLQYGALCWRQGEDGVQVLLITSRDTGRWVIPKGWPIAGLAPEAAAAQEAWEEAGVTGVMNPASLGRYGYQKCLSVTATVPCAVMVYGMRVDAMAKSFPEMKARQRNWFSLTEAATLVAEADLAMLISRFTPPFSGRAVPVSGDEDEGQAAPRKRGRH